MHTAKVTSVAVALALLGAVVPATAGNTTRASVTSGGLQANGSSTSAAGRAASSDGRYVTFHSPATNLVAGDTNGFTDIFVRDRVSGTTVRASLSSAGLQANASSSNPAISADGRLVAFESFGRNLVSNDLNNVSDVFVRDVVANTILRVSVASDGTEANGASVATAISADGRMVAFRSAATNLVLGDTNGVADVFVHDLVTGTTERVSVADDGTEGNGQSTAPALSVDGRFVAFESTASNLVAGDTNAASDVFVHDRLTGTTERVSVATGGIEVPLGSTAASISADGMRVAFVSSATTLVADDTNAAADVFVHDRVTGTTERVSISGAGLQASGASAMPAISANGLVVAFQSSATNLVAGDTNAMADIFVHHCLTGETKRVSMATGGVQANGVSSVPALSSNGMLAVFTSAANNLVANDTNGAAEVFASSPMCGDGAVDTGEACDDGNAVSGDGCDANCTPSACGNGIVAGAETCDDGNLVDGDGCDSNCTPTACGNGVVTAGETCDDGNQVSGDGCDADCTLVACGDGTVDAGELCDDGNLIDGDGCDANCTPTACGNGVMTAGEACDDGNLVDDDGCDSNCTPTACGNGVVTTNEACDDGNALDGDGCDANCTPTACGNGVMTAGEACDDGNLVDGDGCDSNCTPTGCGNGVMTAGEACDDGNAVSGDGCDNNCTPSACGNGVVSAGEACDDGNLTDGDGCDSNCTPTGCGNGVLTAGEICDDGNQVSGDGCEADCTTAPTCTDDMAMRSATLLLDHLGQPTRDDELLLRGEIAVGPGEPAGWKSGDDVEIVIEDLGSGETVLDTADWASDEMDSTNQAGCKARRHAVRWRGNRRYYRSYTGGRGRCGHGSDSARLVIRLLDQRARRGEVDFLVQMRGRALARPTGPMLVTVMLGADVCSASSRSLTCTTDFRGRMAFCR